MFEAIIFVSVAIIVFLTFKIGYQLGKREAYDEYWEYMRLSLEEAYQICNSLENNYTVVDDDL